MRAKRVDKLPGAGQTDRHQRDTLKRSTGAGWLNATGAAEQRKSWAVQQRLKFGMMEVEILPNESPKWFVI